MEEILARSILNLDTISKSNDKPWERLIEYINNSSSTQPINFDFKGISVVQPCSSNSFFKLLANPRFYMTLHNSASTMNSIHIMCTLNNIPKEKVKNIDDVIPRQKTAEEKNIEMMVGQLLPYFETNDNGDVTFNVFKRFDQIGQVNTVKYIEAAIRDYCSKNGCTALTVYTRRIDIQPSVVAMIASMVEALKKDGIEIAIVSDDKDIQNKISMSIDLGKRAYDSQERYDIIKSRLVKNRVGILIKYKEGKARDEFGREGRGEKQSVRIAQFKGICRNRDDELCAKFRTYNTHYFYTRTHWYLEHDGDQLRDLQYDDILIKMDDLGIYNDFLGSKYHFSSAVQYEPGGEVIMYGINDAGSVIDEKLTIPERIKVVFDDFGVEYDRDSLDAYIKETRKILHLDD